MSEETRITANPLAKETRITTDQPSTADTLIYLNDHPEGAEPKPRLLQRFWEKCRWPWLTLAVLIFNAFVMLWGVHNYETHLRQDKGFRENQMEFEKEHKRRQAEIDNNQKVIDNNQKVIDRMQEVIDNNQKEIDKIQEVIDKRQVEIDRNREELQPLRAKDGTLKVHYHRFVLLKYDGKIIALHLLPDPAYGWDGIAYRWYQLTDGTDRFYQPSPSEADASPNPAMKTGSGQTHEDKDSKEGVIRAGPLAIPWSKGNHQIGWLYLSRTANEIEVYPIQFERLEDCSGKLEVKRWVKLRANQR
jgi:TolA-binding protein